MNVIAKMQVTKKAECNYGRTELAAIEVEMHAVYSNDKSDPNFSYSQATPSAEVKMQITNSAVFDVFKTGKKYLVTFTPVED